MQKLSIDDVNGDCFQPPREPYLWSTAPILSTRCDEIPISCSQHALRICLPRKAYSLRPLFNGSLQARNNIASCSSLVRFSNWSRNSTASVLLILAKHVPSRHLQDPLSNVWVRTWHKPFQTPTLQSSCHRYDPKEMQKPIHMRNCDH